MHRNSKCLLLAHVTSFELGVVPGVVVGLGTNIASLLVVLDGGQGQATEGRYQEEPHR